MNNKQTKNMEQIKGKSQAVSELKPLLCKGKRLKVLNLYAGIGGNRKLWRGVDVTAVEWDKATADVYQSFFPDDKVVVGDAHKFLLEHYKEYDFIWSSPPCPTHSKIRLCGTFKGQNKAVYPDMKLYQEVVFLKYHADKNQYWVVENVHPYYPPLVPFSKKIDRHVYWANFKISSLDLGLKYDEVRNSIPKLEEVVGIRVSDSNIDNKLKALRNCVNPEIGKHIFDRVIEIKTKTPRKQEGLFA